MSNVVLRRLRGIAGTMLTWSVGGGLVGAAAGAVIWGAVARRPRRSDIQLR